MQLKPLLHPRTAVVIEAAARNLSHGVLLSGPRGIGLMTVAKFLAISINKATNIQYVLPDEKNTISIDVARELYGQTRTKRAKRIIIIKDADRMTSAAQNAFLKLLEEPTDGLSFLLTSHAPAQLLPTILSRVQQIAIQPVTTEQTEALLDELHVTDRARRIQLQFIANGLPAELFRLASNEQYFTTKAQIVRDARTFLQAAPYEKLLLINQYTDREKALQLVGALLQIISMTIRQKPQPAIVRQLEKLLTAEERIRENGHVRTQLLRLTI